MKRCPLCDFIYEDDQGLCDLDGIELVDDRGALLVPAEAAAHGSVMAVKSPRRKFSVPLLVGVVLGAVISSVYYNPTDGAAPADTDHAAASVAGRPSAASGQVLAVPLAATPTPPSAGSPINDVEGTDTVAPPMRPSPTPSRPRAPKLKGKEPRPEGGKNKKETKLRSFLNKTGRILKKPF